jgi:hypothetical protein
VICDSVTFAFVPKIEICSHTHIHSEIDDKNGEFKVCRFISKFRNEFKFDFRCESVDTL